MDDDVFKAMDIKKALAFNGVRNVTIVHNQEAVWSEIDNGKQIDVIVTDMHYPLKPRLEANHNAGFILIEQMKEKGIEIPVIICSSRNFRSSDVLGTVWYNRLRDIEHDFGELLQKICQ